MLLEKLHGCEIGFGRIRMVERIPAVPMPTKFPRSGVLTRHTPPHGFRPNRPHSVPLAL